MTFLQNSQRYTGKPSADRSDSTKYNIIFDRDVERRPRLHRRIVNLRKLDLRQAWICIQIFCVWLMTLRRGIKNSIVTPVNPRNTAQHGIRSKPRPDGGFDLLRLRRFVTTRHSSKRNTYRRASILIPRGIPSMHPSSVD